MNKKEFIEILFKGAKEGYEKYNILPSLAISQGILESNWGKKHIANNLFGIKAGSNWDGKVAVRKTKEWDGNKYVTKEEKFRAYDSFEDSIKDYTELIGKAKRYEKVRKAKDYKEACRFIYECGYATDPKYPQKLIKIIEDNKLYEYDDKVKSVSNWAAEAWNWAVKNKIIDGTNPKGYGTREQVVTMLYRFNNIQKG